VLNTPFSPWPSYTAEEIDAVAQVLASNKVNYWTGDCAGGLSATSPTMSGPSMLWLCPTARWRLMRP